MYLRKKGGGIDKTMFGIITLLLGTGLIVLASASFSLSEHRFGSPYYFLLRQLLLGLGMGSVLFIIALRIPIDWYAKWSPLLLMGGVFLVILVFIPGIGYSAGGAARWLSLGPFSFQPSEVLKLSFVIYLASWMASKRKHVASFALGFMPFLIITGFVSLFLILEPDIGTLGVIALTSVLLFFLGGGRTGQITAAILLGIIVLAGVIYLEPYRRNRIFIFLNPGSETQGIGYQIDQALIAIGSGGFWGRGWGLSRQKFQYLPEPAGDAIFAIFAEELGFIGAVALLCLFFVFFWRGMLIAGRAKDYFAKYLAAGITLLVITQVIINIGAISGILPLTGIPLPFVSYGGTALAFLLFEMGILLTISRRISP